MAGANIEVSVSGVNEFKQDINKIKQSVQTLNASLKLNEEQFKASGNAEEYMKTKSELLQTKIEQQNRIIENAEKALDKMTKQGTDKASAAFQSMQRTLIAAKGDLLTAQTELKNLGTNAGDAEKGAKGMNEELKRIGKGVSWKNVSDGIGKINDKLEAGAKAAMRIGKEIINAARGSTGWADDLKTLSDETGIDVETLQRMDLAAEKYDTEIDTIISAKDKLAKNRGKLSELLGISSDGKSDEDLFWEVGEALASMGEGFDKAETAQEIFGKSWRELAPLFAAGRTEYETFLNKQDVLSAEQVEKLVKADDAFNEIQAEVQRLKNTFWADNADKITEMLQWIIDNKEAVTGALIAMGGGFAAMKLAETASNVMEIVSGFRTLGLIKGAGAAAQAGAAGASGAGAAGTGVAGTAGAGGIGLSGAMGLGGAAAIAAGFAWAANQRNNNAAQVRGTDANLLARSGGVEGMMVDYLKAQQAVSALTWMEDEGEIAKVTERAAQLRQQLMATNGGQEALAAYSDWRQENSYGSDYWQVPQYLEEAANAMDRMAQLAETLNGGSEQQSRQNSEMTAAMQGLNGLPADIAAAVSKAPINVSIDGTLMTNYFNSQLEPALVNAAQ